MKMCGGSWMLTSSTIEWQLFFDTLAHGDKDHRAWLAGMVQGFASSVEGKQVVIKFDV